MSSGLSSNLINAMNWDNYENCLWLGGNKGLNKISFNSQMLLNKLQTYGEAEGFKGEELVQNGITIDDDGIVWFCTINGLYSYNRKYDAVNKIKPKKHEFDLRLHQRMEKT